MLLLHLSCGWVAGVFLGSLVRLPLPLALILGAGVAVLVAVWWREPVARLGGFLLLVLLAGTIRYQGALSTVDPAVLAYYNDQGDVQLRGVVETEPDLRDQWVNLRVAARQLKVGGEWFPMSGVALVRLPRLPEYAYGDVLELTGDLRTPLEFDDFSYRDYLAHQGILSTMGYPRVARVGSGEGFAPLAWIYQFKRRAFDTLARLLPEPEASLAQGILLGTRTSMPPGVSEAFARTNTTHIIAISGYNIGLVAGLLALLGRRVLSRRGLLAFILVGIVAYAVLVGAAPSVTRAAIMGSIAILAAYYGRPQDVTTGLGLAAVAMTIANPLVLWDIGFQLSFLATAGLVHLSPYLERPMHRLPRWLSLPIAATLAAQLATLPIIAVNFRSFSSVTLPANLLAQPALPGIMLFGSVSTLLGMVWLPLGQVVAWFAWLFLAYMIRVVELYAAIPGASLPLGRTASALAWLYYGLLGTTMALAGGQATTLRGRLAALAQRLPALASLGTLALIAILVWLAAWTAPSDRLTITFFDVGQGDAILIETSGGQRVLIDGGPSPTDIANALGRRLPFWDRALDLVVLSHPHADSLTGLVTVLERYPVRQVLDSGFSQDTPLYDRYLSLIKEKGIPYLRARAGQEIALGEGVRLQVFHPGETFLNRTDSDVNNNSVVLRLVTGGATVLLTGDVEEEGQRYLLASGQPLRSTILKVPHQGGRTSLDREFLAAVAPEVAVISVGAYNRYGHPSSETLDKLKGTKLFRTDLNGTIEVTISQDGYRVTAKR